jgi:hypothetical protein
LIASSLRGYPQVLVELDKHQEVRTLGSERLVSHFFGCLPKNP